jgi:prepilin-type N-terminal cleavage/methylation domain-containing protein
MYKSYYKFTNYKSGFTLVELLVVISIIGILSSFALVSLNSARMKARDALRKGDMAQMRTALSLYYDDNNFMYPICDDTHWTGAPPDFGSAVEAGSNCFNTTLDAALKGGVHPIMMDLPRDPRNPNNLPAALGGDSTYIYRYISNPDGQQYAIIYNLEEDPLTPKVIRGF